MTKQFWLNLPVKDVKKSKEFYSSVGFRFNEQQTDNVTRACMLLGDNNVVAMLFDEATFKGFAGNSLADARTGAEVLLSIDAQSKEEVDELAWKAALAGGKTDHKPGDMKGWMYGCIFSDLDGHRWNVLYMDMSKMH